MDGSGWLSDISIHAPRMGSDPSSLSGFEAISLFQSTLLAWGATFRSAGGSDTLEFQSTLPAWGATRLWLWGMHNANISIHAPSMGSDGNSGNLRRQVSNFNPRSPHGERLRHAERESHRLRKFQSTLPAWGATDLPLCFRSCYTISIHAPRMGSDLRVGATTARCLLISIHAPRMGSDSTAKAYSNDRIKRSTLREPHFLFLKNACFSPIVSMCATTSRTKNQRIRVSFGSYPGLAPTCFTLAWYRFPRL